MKARVNNDQKERYGFIDLVRGITLVSMIFYHATWDLVFLFGKQWDWYTSTAGYIWQQSICWSFILISGFCWNFGKDHLKRGMEVFICGLIITAVTCFAMYDSRVIFGVLSFLGSAMLIMCLLHPIFAKLDSRICLVVSVLCFLISRNVNKGELGFEILHGVKLSPELYKNMFSTFLGFPQTAFFSTDYFSLIPWLFLFFAGYFIYGIIAHRQRLSVFKCERFETLQWVGRHSLIIYMLHQPVLYGIFMLAASVIKS